MKSAKVLRKLSPECCAELRAMVRGELVRDTKAGHSAADEVLAMDSVLVLSSRKASSQWEEQSYTVRRWLKPSFDLGRGPTKSRCMWEKRLAGMGIC